MKPAINDIWLHHNNDFHQRHLHFQSQNSLKLLTVAFRLIDDTYFPKPIDNAINDEGVLIPAFQLGYNKFFVAQNLDRFVGIDPHSQINHGDVRLPHDDFPNSLHKSMQKKKRVELISIHLTSL